MCLENICLLQCIVTMNIGMRLIQEKKHVTSALSVSVEHLAGDIYGKDPKAFINALIHASSSEYELILLIKEMVIEFLSHSMQQCALVGMFLESSTTTSLNDDLEMLFTGKRAFASVKGKQLRLNVA